MTGRVPPVEDTRARVIAAARAAFAAHGYGGAGLRGIAADAGLSAMALYTYAPSKAALYELVYREGIATIYGEFAEVVADRSSLDEEIDALFAKGGELLQRDPDLLRFSIRVVLDRDHPELADLELITSPYQEFFHGLVERNVARGDVAPEQSADLVRAITMQLWGLTAMAAVDPSHIEPAVHAATAALEGHLAR